MCNSMSTSEIEDWNREQGEASQFIMKTLAVLLIIALLVGYATGQFGLAFYGAFMAWIPAVVIVGGIHDKRKARLTVAY